ncbi:MAG: LysM peptidoglycan-binding domain-containing protein [Flavobacteriales bacterium]
MTSIKYIFIVLILSLSFSSLSQEKREIIDGEEFIIHTIKKGETLYGITQKYKVTKKELRSSNSGLLLFIKEGQKMNVPVPLNQRRLHVVKKGETLYGISKKYGISMDDLVKLNPDKSTSINEGDRLVLRKTGTTAEIPKTKTPELKIPEPKIAIDKMKYTVKPGETLYSISRKFNISLTELKALNPGISESINAGDVIWVPKSKEIVVEPIKNQEMKVPAKTIEYTVKRGETFYGISKKYNTTVEAIQKSNPGVETLKEGDKLTIVLPPKFVNDIKVTLGDPQNPDGFDGSKVNKINPLKEKLDRMVMKETYSVSLFLPLMLDKNAQIKIEPNKPKRINSDTERSTHFYQGVLMAMDSITQTGVSFNLQVYDTENDTAEVRKHLRTNELKETDLIIGPFLEKPYKEVANFSQSNGVQAISPINVPNRIMFENKNVTMLNASLPTQVTYLASYIAENKNTQNVICVSGQSKKEKYLTTLFSDTYNNAISGKTDNYRSKASKFNMTSFSSMKGFDAKLVKGKKNIIILPILSKGMATAFFTQLNITMVRSRMKGYEVEVYGLENFMGFNDIDTELKLKYNLHVTSSSFIDYKSDTVKNFIKNYRARFGTEPNRYAFIGFDAAMYHGLALINFGRGYTDHYDKIKLPLIQSNYILKRTDLNSGFENKNVFILGYKDFDLVRMN